MSPTWSDAAACRDADPDLFDADESTGRAKAVCRGCPVADDCLRYALDHRIDEGVLGGLTGQERVSLRRAMVRRRLTAAEVAARVEEARNPQQAAPRPRTIQEHAARHTVRIFGGHLEWVGPKRPWIDGRSYTPLQVLFVADRGRQPEGRVVAGCAHTGCVKPSHITDEAERRFAAARFARAA